MRDDEATRLGEALMPEFLRLRALDVPIRDAVLGALAKHKRRTALITLPVVDTTASEQP